MSCLQRGTVFKVEGCQSTGAMHPWYSVAQVNKIAQFMIFCTIILIFSNNDNIWIETKFNLRQKYIEKFLLLLFLSYFFHALKGAAQQKNRLCWGSKNNKYRFPHTHRLCMFTRAMSPTRIQFVRLSSRIFGPDGPSIRCLTPASVILRNTKTTHRYTALYDCTYQVERKDWSFLNLYWNTMSSANLIILNLLAFIS